MIDSNEHLTICNVNGRFMSFLLTSNGPTSRCFCSILCISSTTDCYKVQ